MMHKKIPRNCSQQKSEHLENCQFEVLKVLNGPKSKNFINAFTSGLRLFIEPPCWLTTWMVNYIPVKPQKIPKFNGTKSESSETNQTLKSLDSRASILECQGQKQKPTKPFSLKQNPEKKWPSTWWFFPPLWKMIRPNWIISLQKIRVISFSLKDVAATTTCLQPPTLTPGRG